MRGIERLVAGALLVMAVTGTAVLARTSAPGGGHARPLRLQSPPRSNLVAPLPVVVTAPPAAPLRLLTRPAKPSMPATQASVAVAQPVEAPAVAPAAPAPEPTPAPATPSPAAPSPAPTPAPTPPAATRVVAAAQPAAPVTTTTKTFGHSHPRGHAWGHVKHAITTLSTDDAQGDDPATPPPVVAPTPPAVPEPQPAPDPGNGNGNGHAYGRSKNGKGD